VESGEGIERSKQHTIYRQSRKILWNPVKELKVTRDRAGRLECPCCVESGEGIESAARPLSIAYTSPYVESGEGIERLQLKNINLNLIDHHVESGEGIESYYVVEVIVDVLVRGIR